MMDQAIQLLLSLASIFILGALAKYYWPSDRSLDAARVSRSLRRSLYFDEIDRLCLSKNSKSAIVRLKNAKQTLVLLECFGDRVVTRDISRDAVKAWINENQHIRITFNDFTHPSYEDIFNQDALQMITNWLGKECKT